MSIASQSKPIRRKSKKTIAKEARAKRLNRRITPEAVTIRERIVRAILSRLYDKQYKHWNSKLLSLSWENASSQGRDKDKIRYAIYWNHRRYSATYRPFEEPQEKVYCLPLNPRISEYADRMEEIAEELDELREERYEAQRFLANLFTFEAPPERFEKVLGATLFRVAESGIRWLYADVRESWEDNSEFGLQTFVESNEYIIQKMNERIMLNIVTV